MEKYIEILKNNGLIVEKKNEIFNFLNNKHYSRLAEIVRLLRTYKIKPKQYLVLKLYEIDVIARRKLHEILKPLEVQIASQLCYWVEEMELTTEELISLSFLREPNFTSAKNEESYHKNIKRMKKTIMEIYDNGGSPYNSPWKIINEFTFGQKVAFIKLMNEEDLREIKHLNKHNKQVLVGLLDDLVTFRNHIAHHNLLLTTEKIYGQPASRYLKRLLYSTHIYASSDYRKIFKEYFTEYKYNSINKYKKGGADKETIENIGQLFDILLDHFGIISL